jgi:hypothetical protein
MPLQLQQWEIFNDSLSLSRPRPIAFSKLGVFGGLSTMIAFLKARTRGVSGLTSLLDLPASQSPLLAF